ncbi:MAG: hypothetical protein A2086_13290 [Spirochaetes bacterium GWD1_27_9]|nr:MAG: hypothetical protein A2Z98_15195 [Spirochaetes bacterium GWB1_27_13]OHD27002.1 MAG: hypothetical protein A2Y34_07690 [Spirochaetes bacterium GWC1_27_15]OHD45671.1 MAG: hypothetical protein A2086_13290 [Spirochaetes bacterium GWD1_27_9]
MIRKNICLLLLLFNSFLFAEDLVLNKIIYKKVLLDFDQPSLINVYLNPMNVSDVVVMFNGKELKNIHKNFNSFIKDDTNFFPSFNFEVTNVKKENLLQIYVVLSQGLTINSEATIFFEKGIVIDDSNFQTKKNKVFFVKAGEYYNDEIFYDLKIENDSLIEKLEEIVRNNFLYYKLKTIKTGTTRLDIFKYDESLEKQDISPIKSIKITIQN